MAYITKAELENTDTVFSIEGPGSRAHNAEVDLALILANDPEFQAVVAMLLRTHYRLHAVSALNTMAEL